MDDLVVIKEIEGFLEGEILKAKLDSFEIPCMLKRETARRLFGLTLNGLGKVRLVVPSKFKDEALAILNEEA